jgi:outer membrane lipopolysaccharide assembly protein LptE/RlpB
MQDRIYFSDNEKKKLIDEKEQKMTRLYMRRNSVHQISRRWRIIGREGLNIAIQVSSEKL